MLQNLWRVERNTSIIDLYNLKRVSKKLTFHYSTDDTKSSSVVCFINTQYHETLSGAGRTNMWSVWAPSPSFGSPTLICLGWFCQTVNQGTILPQWGGLGTNTFIHFSNEGISCSSLNLNRRYNRGLHYLHEGLFFFNSLFSKDILYICSSDTAVRLLKTKCHLP